VAGKSCANATNELDPKMSARNRINLFAATVVALVLSAGALAADDVKTTTIHGTVILDGKPFAGRILLHDDDGQFVGAKLDQEGKFAIKRVPIGAYRVTIEGKGIPPKYSADEASLLTVQVADGENRFNFELTSK
jgi:hypothetical protein